MSKPIFVRDRDLSKTAKRIKKLLPIYSGLGEFDNGDIKIPTSKLLDHLANALAFGNRTKLKQFELHQPPEICNRKFREVRENLSLLEFPAKKLQESMNIPYKCTIEAFAQVISPASFLELPDVPLTEFFFLMNRSSRDLYIGPMLKNKVQNVRTIIATQEYQYIKKNFRTVIARKEYQYIKNLGKPYEPEHYVIENMHLEPTSFKLAEYTTFLKGKLALADYYKNEYGEKSFEVIDLNVLIRFYPKRTPKALLLLFCMHNIKLNNESGERFLEDVEREKNNLSGSYRLMAEKLIESSRESLKRYKSLVELLTYEDSDRPLGDYNSLFDDVPF